MKRFVMAAVVVALAVGVGRAEGAARKGMDLVVLPRGKALSTSLPVFSGGKDYSATVWLGYRTLEVELANEGNAAANVGLLIQGAPPDMGWDKYVLFSASMAGGTRAVWRIPLLFLTYSKGAYAWPSQGPFGRFRSQGMVRPFSAGQVTLGAEGGEPGKPVRVFRLSLADPHPRSKWVDRFGQQCCADWPGKVKSDADLTSADKKEADELAGIPADPERDEYQAWKAGPQVGATGFFRVQKVGGVWWLVAPNGRLFFSQGMDCVINGVDARMDGLTRPAFSWLPPRKGRFAKAWAGAHGAVKNETEPLWPSFNRVNMIRKWGPERFEQEYRERAFKRLQAWGFTTLGNWSDPTLFPMRKMPYVTTGPETWKLWDKCTYAAPGILDAFHPRFESAAREVCMELAKYKDDPWCVGHFLENEIWWAALAGEVLGLPDDAPAKARLVKDLKDRYGTLARLNAAWGTSATAFALLRWPEEGEPTAAARRDMGRFIGEFTDRWYGTWARGMREADPNHLILGDRYAMEPEFEEVVVSAGKHFDVVSINYYDLEVPRETFDRYHKLTGRPMLIGEYGFNSMDGGWLTSAVPVRDMAERGVGYRYYTERTAAIPYIVGLHYFQYWDEPVMGRFDRETSFNGFVSVADIPYQALVDAARETNARIYRVHAGKVKPEGREPVE